MSTAQKSGYLGSMLGSIPSLSGDIEFRVHKNGAFSIALVNGQLVNSQKQESSGLSARAMDSGIYGFAAHPDWTPKATDLVIDQAVKNLSLLRRGHTSNLKNIPPGQSQVTPHMASRYQPWTDEETIGRLKVLDEKIVKLGPEVKSRKVMMREQSFDKEIWTGMGGHGQFCYTRTHIYLILAAETNSGPVEVMNVFGGHGYIENIFPSDAELDAILQKTYEDLRDKMEGVYAKGGKHTVILASKLAGILAHEAIGHTTEADLVRGGSIAGEMLGSVVASPLVTLTDFAHSYNGVLCPVPIYQDDECVEASDTVIIQDGVLKTFMNSRETAAVYGQKATGHARAWGFNDEPLIRMRNTAILPGTNTLEELIASVEDGYYLLDHSNGQADSTSEFMFGVTMGYEIKNGKLGKALLDTTISGVAFEMLKSVSMVSNEMTWVDSGTCGKKQPMYVGMGGPAIKCEVNMGGR